MILTNDFQTSSDSNASSAASSPAPKKNLHAKAAMFDNKPEEKVQPPADRVCKQLDESKTAFLNQTIETKQTPFEKAPGQLDQNKISQFMKDTVSETLITKNNNVR